MKKLKMNKSASMILLIVGVLLSGCGKNNFSPEVRITEKKELVADETDRSNTLIYAGENESTINPVLTYHDELTDIIFSGLMKYDGDGYYLMTSEEIEELFKDYPEALDTSLEIAEKCNINIELNNVNMPKYVVPEPFKSMEEYFEHLVHKGFKSRFKGTVHENDPVYKERFDYELAMIKQMGFEDYFIVVWDFINYCRTHNIYVGPGRGSAAGSIIAYCLGITDLDPIKYNLLFERFLNPDRISMPDFDVDFCYERRRRSD